MNIQPTSILNRVAPFLAATLITIAAILGATAIWAQTPTPWPTWPPPPTDPARGKVISVIAQLLRDSVKDPDVKTALTKCDSAYALVQKRLDTSVTLPTDAVFLFYEPTGGNMNGSLTYPKNGFYSIFHLPKDGSANDPDDAKVFKAHFVCCYEPW
jgi:hypothetical protein